jgi:peptidylprolyl isomerase
VATSRRRERELARRRHERRRQAELERRARSKRRNTVLGASVGTIAVIALLVVLGIVIFGGSNGKSNASTATSPSATPSATPSSPPPAAPTKCATIKPNPPAKGEPVVPDVKGKAPTKLVVHDIKVGKGPGAKSGDKITVKYVGVACSTGKAFDASYTDPANSTTHKKQLEFVLGKGQVIPGWDQGLIGIKKGGVRQLVIPASLAYGTTGAGSAIKPNETLNFVVTAVKV